MFNMIPTDHQTYIYTVIKFFLNVADHGSTSFGRREMSAFGAFGREQFNRISKKSAYYKSAK
jgi:hypothetical protein